LSGSGVGLGIQEVVEAGHPGTEDGHDAEGVAGGGFGVMLDAEAGDGGVSGVEEKFTESAVDGVGKVALAGAQLGSEGGFGFPEVEGGAVDAQEGGDRGDGFAGGEEGNGGELTRGEVGLGAVGG
jgi:hypothetical protein